MVGKFDFKGEIADVSYLGFYKKLTCISGSDDAIMLTDCSIFTHFSFSS